MTTLPQEYLAQLLTQIDDKYLSSQHDYAKRIIDHCERIVNGSRAPISDNELHKVYLHLANLFTVLANETKTETTESEVQ